MRKIAIVVHNVRSCHNVGSILRSADGLGARVYLTGYTPYPLKKNDPRLPHVAKRAANQIAKTSLGAENSVVWQQYDQVQDAIDYLRSCGMKIIALEQSAKAINLPEFKPPENCALIVGPEVTGLEGEVLDQTDEIVEIPMQGKKESFNVAVAAAIALYHTKFASKIK